MTDRNEPWLLGAITQPADSAARCVFDGRRIVEESELEMLRSATSMLHEMSGNTLLRPLYDSANELGAHIKSVIAAPSPDMSFDRISMTTRLVDQFLNQLPIFRSRLRRATRKHLGEGAEQAVTAQIDAEYHGGATPFRIIWELRNAAQHGMTAASVLVMRNGNREGGFVRIDEWKAKHDEFPSLFSAV